MSDQTPEQTENDEQGAPTGAAEEYGSLTVEDNPEGTVFPSDLAGTADESDDQVVYQPEHSEEDLDN